MQPILRRTDYIEEYRKLVYDSYVKAHNIVLTTYYQLDYSTTVYDSNYQQTYKRTGEQSGRHYNKIHLMPVIFATQASATMDAMEKGVSFTFDSEINITIDPQCGLVPHVGDIVYFNISGDYSSWLITNTEQSGTFENPYYRCSMRVERIRPNTFTSEKISGEFIFVEYFKKVFTLTAGTNIIRLMDRLDNLVRYLNTVYNHNLCLHHHQYYLYPELETILYSYETCLPPSVPLLRDICDVSINPAGILMMLCVPSIYDTTNPPIETFVRTYLHPRSKIFANYLEYSTNTAGDHNVIDIFYGDDALVVRTWVDTLYQYLLGNAPVYEVDQTSIGYLVDEWIKYMESETYADYETQTPRATNLLEAVMEYCIIGKKLLRLNTTGATLS